MSKLKAQKDIIEKKELQYIPSRVLVLKNQVIGSKMPGEAGAVINKVFQKDDVIQEKELIELLINNNGEFEDISPRT